MKSIWLNFPAILFLPHRHFQNEVEMKRRGCKAERQRDRFFCRECSALLNSLSKRQVIINFKGSKARRDLLEKAREYTIKLKQSGVDVDG